SWNIYWEESAGERGGPILSIKLEETAQRVHVTRGLLCRVWEPFAANGNVIETRLIHRWLSELMGTIELDSHPATELHAELIRLLLRGVIGLSRLPLTSIESPLPGFSLGKMAYFYRQSGDIKESIREPDELIRAVLSAKTDWLEKAKL